MNNYSPRASSASSNSRGWRETATLAVDPDALTEYDEYKLRGLGRIASSDPHGCVDKAVATLIPDSTLLQFDLHVVASNHRSALISGVAATLSALSFVQSTEGISFADTATFEGLRIISDNELLMLQNTQTGTASYEIPADYDVSSEATVLVNTFRSAREQLTKY